MNKSLRAASAAFAFTLALTACGGGGGGGGSSTASPPPSGGTPPPPPANDVTVVGMLTGFGSIFVNGIEFETDDARFEVDDSPAFDDSSLSVGMVVRVKGSVNADGVSGKADDVSYDDEVEGPVANLAVDPDDDTLKNFTVFGGQVVADANLTVFRAEDDPDFGFDTMADGDHVEVSGFYDGALIATYIKKEDQDDDEYEAKGTVSGASGDQFTLNLAGSSTLAVTLAQGAQIPAAGIQDGQFVEVEGTLPDPVGAPDELLAFKVEIEDDDFFEDEDEGEAEIEGILTQDPATGDWSIGGTTLAFDAGTEYEPESLRNAIADGSADGLWVKAEGDLLGDTLRVDEIEIEGAEGPDGDIEIRGLVRAVDPSDAVKVGTLTIGFPPLTDTVTVETNEQTMFADDDSLSPFDLTNLAPGSSFVKVKAYRDSTGDLVASRLEREDGSRYEIQATADDVQPGVSITVLDVTFGIDANTEQEDGVPSAGDFVEVEDDNRDGIADEIELEDD